MAQDEIIKKIKNYLKDLTEAGIKVKRAFLYGSYAAGNMNEDSDIDLLIVYEEVGADSEQASITAWKLTRKTDTRIEPYLVSPKKFNDNISPLIMSVKKNGIEISPN
jgi:predicted nucleotidyltransferase